MLSIAGGRLVAENDYGDSDAAEPAPSGSGGGSVARQTCDVRDFGSRPRLAGSGSVEKGKQKLAELHCNLRTLHNPPRGEPPKQELAKNPKATPKLHTASPVKL